MAAKRGRQPKSLEAGSGTTVNINVEIRPNADEVYQVEKLVAKRIVDGVTEYRVRWQGYEEMFDTWEPIDNCHCADLIRQFEEENKDVPPEIINTITAPVKKRGRKRKGGSKETSAEVDQNQAENGAGQEVPNVLKDSYHLQELAEGVSLANLMGMDTLPTNASQKMALVSYTDDVYEFLPVEVLRKDEKGKELLIDFFLERMQFIR